MDLVYFRRMAARFLIAALGPLALGACDEGTSAPAEEGDDMDLFASAGKTDTGYVSDQAAELDAELSGKVVLDLTAVSADEKARLVAAAQAGDKSAFGRYPTDQVKYARNVLKEEKFNANMEGGDAAIASLKAVGETIEIVYTVKVESLVKEKDLQSQGVTLSQLVGRVVNMRLPADPTQAFLKGGITCAQDPDDPNEDVATEISEYNYFYYWMPDKAGCALPTEAATFTVKNPAAAKATYPELNQLLADQKITMVVLFGQLEHGELLSGEGADGEWDWGWIGYEDFTGWLRGEGYKETSRTPAGAEVGKVARSQWSKKYSAGMTVVVDVISPMDLQDHADQVQKDGILASAVKEHEIVYYNGHSFYGSLKVLDDPKNFPSYYQIVFMDSCWSYAYYTKQVFASKATAEDPTGMLKADVLNNTEPGISGSHVTFQIFLKKLFTAANFVAQKTPSKAKNYTWKNLVSYMNTSAKKRAEGSDHAPEIYGVSGVATNVYKP